MSGRTPTFLDAIERMAIRRIEQHEEDFRRELEWVASPIEKVFVATMLSHGWRSSFELWPQLDAARERLVGAGFEIAADDGGVLSKVRLFTSGWPYLWTVCASQATLRLRDRTIRPDFAFVWTCDEHIVNVIVELDGHDFHERTPEQAQSDKSRDRELQAMGWRVLRYTGREVLRSPVECLHEVERLVESRSRAFYEALYTGTP
jgi:very-short-patch-repair endonuclease